MLAMDVLGLPEQAVGSYKRLDSLFAQRTKIYVRRQWAILSR